MATCFTISEGLLSQTPVSNRVSLFDVKVYFTVFVQVHNIGQGSFLVCYNNSSSISLFIVL